MPYYATVFMYIKKANLAQSQLIEIRVTQFLINL